MPFPESAQSREGPSQRGSPLADEARLEAAATDALALATRQAVASSQAEMERLEAQMDLLLDKLQAIASNALKHRSDARESDPAWRLADILKRDRHKIEDLLQRQRSALETFNIVLFGRTGAGKSSMITAMTRGDGAAVSRGESDWTTDVQPIPWHSCMIYDTPGINGWGRSQSRDHLEGRARAAVEVADLVLVCFDTQSQQIEEFAKLAGWVTHYRKPLVVVLNQRNPVWRVPDRAPSGASRANLSQTIAEHAGHIRDELGRLGLVGVPLVAVNTKRAVAARAALPFKGPDLEGLIKQRNAHGCDTLEAWSNYGRLERFLAQAVREQAVAFRLGALNDQLRGVFEGLRHQFGQLGGEARHGAETLERDMLVPLLRLVGYPRKDDAEARAAMVIDGQDLLTELERRRGGAFQAATEGEYARQTRRLIETGFNALRMSSLRKAEACVIDAFESGKEVDGESVRRDCFDEPAMRRVAEEALVEGFEYLRDKAALAERDTRFTLNLQIHASAVAGASGDWWKYSAWALKGGGILSGTVGALAGIAMLSNPVGWGLAAVALVGGLVATLFGWLGDSAARKAEEAHLAARRTVMAKLRKMVHATYDEAVKELRAQVRETAVSASTKLLLPPIRQALELRRVAECCDELTSLLDRQLDELPDRSHPQALLWDIARRQEQAAFPNMANAAALHWLGEDWITDPRGLRQQAGPMGMDRPEIYSAALKESLFDGMGRIFERATCDVTLEDACAWLNEVADRCADDPLARIAVSELRAIAEDGRPRIHLLGDYNAGKSSFIKRLLIEAGLPVPASLEVAAKPMTAAVLEYDWNGLVLVDSPGFQSGDPAHAELAWDAFPDASAVIFLFQPNLILGDDRALRTVMLGDGERRLIAKRDRACFIINRADELGADPELSPAMYVQLTERKRLELVQALASRGVEADDDCVVFMASDPYGLVGNRRDVDASAFDAHRAWDGFDHFCASLHRARPSLLASGAARSVLEGGIARLARLKKDRSARAELGIQAVREIKRVVETVDEIIRNGKQLGDRSFETLQRLVEDFVSVQKEEVLAERDMATLRIKADALSQWWTDPALQIELAHWQKTCADALETWRAESIEILSRRIESVEFRHVCQVRAKRFDGVVQDAQGKGPILEALDKIGRSLGGATRDVVYGIGKALGFKFKPWGAVKLARNVAKVGTVIAVLGVAMDVAFLFVDEKRRKEREEQRQELANFLLKSADQVVHAVAFGSDDEAGLLPQLGDALAVFAQHARGLNETLGLQEKEIASEKQWIATYTELSTRALKRLERRAEANV